MMAESGENRKKEMRFYLERVHCADCVRDLMESVVAKVDGVTGVGFDDDELCLVVEAESHLDEGSLRDAIRDLGYSLRDPGSRPLRPSKTANAIFVAVAVILLIALIVWLRNI